MFRLALPVVIAELGWMAMGVVDTLMVGRLGPEAIGAVGPPVPEPLELLAAEEEAKGALPPADPPRPV